MTRRLPPLNALRAFEAAARHLSFTKAAEELYVTPAAVSQQVRLLEDHLGTKLFRRLNRALVLTDAGQVMQPPLGEGFDRLAQAVERLERLDENRTLTVSVTPSFGAKWLVPRLESFRRAHPSIDVRLDATDRQSDFERDGVDVALRYGRGVYPGLTSELLLEEHVFPVCSPGLLQGQLPLATPADLRHHTLLHIEWRTERESAPSWGMWLKAAGLDEVPFDRGPRYNMEQMAIQAAIEGQGVALALAVLVADDLASGRLVQPFDRSIRSQTQFSYYLVHPSAKSALAKVRAFREWVLAEASRMDAVR